MANSPFANFLKTNVQDPLNQRFALANRNQQLTAQAYKDEAGLLGRRLTGMEAGRDLWLALLNSTNKATPEQQQQFLQKTPGQVGLDFAGILPALLGARLAAPALRNVVQPLQRTIEYLPEAANPSTLAPTQVMSRGPINIMNLARAAARMLPQREYELLQRRAAGQFAKGFERIIKK